MEKFTNMQHITVLTGIPNISKHSLAPLCSHLCVFITYNEARVANRSSKLFELIYNVLFMCISKLNLLETSFVSVKSGPVPANRLLHFILFPPFFLQHKCVKTIACAFKSCIFY